MVAYFRLLLSGLFAGSVEIAPEYGSIAAYASGPSQTIFTDSAGLRDAVRNTPPPLPARNDKYGHLLFDRKQAVLVC